MRHNKTWNGLLPVVGIIALVVLSGCAKEKLEVTESGFSCSGEINSNVWECTGSGRMERDDLQQTFVMVDDESVQETLPVAEAPVEKTAPVPPEPEWAKSIPEKPVVTPVIAEPPVTPQVASSPVDKPQIVATVAPVAESIPQPEPQPECQSAYSAEHFYLQFSASRTDDGLKVLAARLLPVETDIISTTVKGDIWLVLISTGFSSREAAQSVASLLQKQGVSKPWIRPGYSVLAALEDQGAVKSSTSGCQ